MSEQGRLEYLQKIRSVEATDKEISESGDYNVTQYQDSGGAPVAPLSSAEVPIVGNTTYVIPEIKTYPTKIILSTGERHTCNAAAKVYAQANISNTDVFSTLDASRFDVKSPGFPYELCLRKDLIYYLTELHGIVTPKIKVSKLYVCSLFRTWDYHVAIYKGYGYKSEDIPQSSPHLGAIAVDISATDNNRYIIADTAFYMGFGGIAVGDDFVHIDIGPYGRWTYNGTPTYISPDKHNG